MSNLYQIARPLLFRLDPEKAHKLTLRALKAGLIPACGPLRDKALEQTLWGLKFPNPVGLAAGFDKNAEAIGPAFALGFGFVEAGTVTPRPQRGNEGKRVFRWAEGEAVINRMGFPNAGMNAFKANLEKFLSRKPRPPGALGLNIGMNKSQTDPAQDYTILIRMLGPLADYLTINISSPNTPGLRDLQEPETLKPLLEAVLAERAKCCRTNPPPVLLKLSPDLDEGRRADIARVVLDAGIDGLILTNTTLARPPGLPDGFAAHQGGLSGAPLRDLSTETIRSFYRLTDGKIPIIGVGGVSTGKDAYEKIKAGASLVQLYSSLVFKGPYVANYINRELLDCLKEDGLAHIGEAVGRDAGKT